LTVPDGLPCPVTFAVRVNGAFCTTFAEPVETVVEVANGPDGGGGGGGTAELPPPQPMIKLMTKTRPNPNDGRKSLHLHAQQRDSRAARPLRRLRGQSGFVPNGKRKAPRFDTKTLRTRAAPEGADSVNIAVDVAPLARFTVEGCNEQV